jgi:hypothetical protein
MYWQARNESETMNLIVSCPRKRSEVYRSDTESRSSISRNFAQRPKQMTIILENVGKKERVSFLSL